MLKHLKMKSIKNAISVVFIYIIVWVIYLYFFKGSMLAQFRDVLNLNETAAAELEVDRRYSVTVDWTAGWVDTVEGSRGRTRAGKGPDQDYFAIFSKDDEKLIMVRAIDKDSKLNFKFMLEDEYEGKDPTPFQVVGHLREYRWLNDEKGKMQEFCKRNGLDTDVFVPYILDVQDNIGPKFIIGITIVMGVGGILILLHLFRALSGGKLNQLKQEMAESGLTIAEIEEDYKSAYEIDKAAEYRIGNKALYFFNYSKPHMVLLEDLVWIYEDYIADKGRTGIEGKKHYYHKIRTRQDKYFAADLSSKNRSTEALRELMHRTPWILMGPNNAYEKMRIDELMEIKYNKTEKKPFRRY